MHVCMYASEDEDMNTTATTTSTDGERVRQRHEYEDDVYCARVYTHGIMQCIHAIVFHV